MMKKLYLLPLSLLFISTGCSDDGEEFVADPEVEGTPMKVMSYNIRYINTLDVDENAWSARRQPSIDMILDESPDLIGYQEMRGEQREDMMMGLTDIYGIYGPYDEGASLTTCGYVDIMYRKDRFDVIDKGFFWLSTTPDVASRPGWGATDTQYRTAVWMYLHDKVANKDFYFCDTHLPYQTADNAARTACVSLIVERLKAKAGRDIPVILTGDMNASWSSKDTRRACLEGYFEWMWSAREDADENLNPNAYSYNGFGASTPAVTWDIDHIFYRKVNAKAFNVVTSDKYGVKYVSDHYPITLSLTY
jgi:endonuclease/exonuclease/phosphatase family metal-dependent hydrolase